VANDTPKALVGKLNDTSRRALEAAAGLCQSRTNYNVEVEHWLLKLLETPDSDFTRILHHFDVDAGKVGRELTRTLDRLKTGSARIPGLSEGIMDLMRAAWDVASLEFGAPRIRTGYLLAALLVDPGLARQVGGSSPELARVPAEQLSREMANLIAGSVEDESRAAEDVPHGPGVPAAGSKTPALDQFTLNLTERARKGEIDPVIGRDFEIRQVIDILTRRRQNNPILTGEAGVGKTAVVEGFALRVAAGDVPESLKPVEVRTLDLGLLQAGAGVKGEFENRLKSVIAEVKASPRPVILFIDEAHTIIGAGGQAGQGDAANLLKPALARGELRTIAATTWAEYKKYFENDAALKRRFQVVKVDEPDVPLGVRMMRGLAGTLEKHHKVRILDEAVEDAVRLSHRYITDRQLPDKAITLLDTACARVALGQSATPPALEDCQRDIDHLELEIGILERESAVGAEHRQRLQELSERKQAAEQRKAALTERWAKEKKLVAEIQKARARLEGHAGAGADPKKAEHRLSPADEKRTLDELGRLRDELAKLQGESPLVQPVVDRQAVAEVVARWTGIPVGKMVLDEIKTVLTLKEKLAERVVGQDYALDAVARRIQTARGGMGEPGKPIGVFLLVGPSGVGKTETAMALADILYGGHRNLIVLNMSEYQGAMHVSRLTGSAPGLVGYGEGSVLTEGVRRKPYSIVLLDEVEKADRSAHNIFHQIFDKGSLRNDKGDEVDFKNTILVLTSNAGSATIEKLCTADPDTVPPAGAMVEALQPDLLKVFEQALLNRMTVVPYLSLSDAVIRRIVSLKLARVADRVRENYKASFRYDDAVADAIAARCTEVETGARNIDHILTGTLLPEMSRMFLEHMAEGKQVAEVRVGVGADKKFTYEIE
jgi:type VI secretion system protein VasG